MKIEADNRVCKIQELHIQDKIIQMNKDIDQNKGLFWMDPKDYWRNQDEEGPEKNGKATAEICGPNLLGLLKVYAVLS